jgi:PAT family beta-lactamase induction signal transducer AmpG
MSDEAQIEEGNAEPTPTVDGKVRSPWTFVPSLYFMQGLPVMVVQSMSVTMYKKMGVDNAQIGLWTSLIAFPWIVKMLWGPLVDTSGLKRGWIVTMQAAIIAGLGALAFTMGSDSFLPLSLAAMFMIAFMSATHDIAADGFYLLALKEKAQAFFVGIRSASFRLATIFTTGVMVVIAGRLEANGTPIPRTWTIAILVGAGVYALLYAYGHWAYPRPVSDVPKKAVDIPKIAQSFGQILLMMAALFLIGRLVVIGAAATNGLFPKPVFTKSVELTPLFLPTSATHVDEVRESRVLEEAEKVGVQPADDKAQKAANARPSAFFTPAVQIPYGLQLVFSLAVIGAAYLSTRELFRRTGMGPAATEYFGENKIVAILGFILFYRFGESMISKMSSPFLLDPAEKGGLGVSTETVGYITGTVGVIALTVGGLLGGWLISEYGIKKCIWPMVLALNIPNLFYVWAAFAKPGAGAVTGLIAADQFGYGFGFAAYMVYLMFLAQGSKMQTSHYAISTGLMALGAQIAGITSGYLQMAFAGPASAPNSQAYFQFFIAVVLCTIPGMVLLFFIPMDKQDLKVAPVDID